MAAETGIVVHTDNIFPAAHHGARCRRHKGELEVPYFSTNPFRKASSRKREITIAPKPGVVAPVVRKALALNVFQSNLICFWFCTHEDVKSF